MDPSMFGRVARDGSIVDAPWPAVGVSEHAHHFCPTEHELLQRYVREGNLLHGRVFDTKVWCEADCFRVRMSFLRDHARSEAAEMLASRCKLRLVWLMRDMILEPMPSITRPQRWQLRFGESSPQFDLLVVIGEVRIIVSD
jgi:hypothetical protein